MGHQWSFGTLHWRFTSLFSWAKWQRICPGTTADANCVLGKRLHSLALHSLLCGWGAAMCYVIHVIPSPPHCPLPWPPALPEHPSGYSDAPRRRHGEGWVQEPVIKTTHSGGFSVWKSGLQGDSTQQAGTTTARFGRNHPSLLSFLNHPVCSLTTVLFLIAAGYVFLVTTSASKW